MRNVKNATVKEVTCMTKITQSHARFVAPTLKDGGNWKNTTATTTASMHAKMVAEQLLIRNHRRR